MDTYVLSVNSTRHNVERLLCITRHIMPMETTYKMKKYSFNLSNLF